MIRTATLADVDRIKKLLDEHSADFGFTTRGTVVERVKQQEVYIDDATGAFVMFHQRLDGVTRIYDIISPPDTRRRGIARQLVDMLLLPVTTKCPVGSDANGFWERVGFHLVGVEKGKKRDLNVWLLQERKHD